MILDLLYQRPGLFLLLLFICILWELVWKSFGLWHAARNGQTGWFIAIILLNTLGLLPIIYLLWFKPRKERKTSEKVVDIKTARRTVRKR